MEGAQIGLLVSRLFLLLSACVVLGTSADLAEYLKNPLFQYFCRVDEDQNSCDTGGLLRGVEYSAFVGAWGLLDALVGLAGIFAGIPWIAIAVLDGLAIIFFLAGGIDIAVWLGTYPCNSGSRCSELKADDAFLFLGFLSLLAILPLVFMWQRRK